VLEKKKYSQKRRDFIMQYVILQTLIFRHTEILNYYVAQSISRQSDLQ